MSENTGSGWDDLQYPYGLLNIKNLDMPSYPNFVSGNLSRVSEVSPCFASLNMTSEITPFFNSRLEVMNIKKFIEDGGITVLDPEKTYVIKMPKLIKQCPTGAPYGINTVRHETCHWESPYEITYEYTYFIRPLNKTRMSLNLDLYDKNDSIQPWNLGDDGLNIFTVTRFQTFSSGNTSDNIYSSTSDMSCLPKKAYRLQNIRKPDCITRTLSWGGGLSYSSTSVIADYFTVKESYYGEGPATSVLRFCKPPLEIFTDGVTHLLTGDPYGPLSFEFKLLVGSCYIMTTTNTTKPGIKNKTRLPHTLTMLARDKEKEVLPGIALTGNPIQLLFNSMFKFENVDNSDKKLGLVIIPLLNITY